MKRTKPQRRETENFQKTSAKRVVFTITARNYIPYATVLYRSLMRHMPHTIFYLAVADSNERINEINLEYQVISLGDLQEDRVFEMAERYNITEFCTAIKPFVFKYLYDFHPDATVCYIDPDILAVSPFEEVYDLLDRGANLVLTPHVLEVSRHEEVPDSTMLKYGSYNLGFLGTRANSETAALMQWWCDRLEYECVIDLPAGIFVDQKWADLFPSIIDNVAILRHPGYNVAYWNLLQRPVTFDGETWRANGQPLRFAHFSGNEMTKPGIFSRHGWYIDYSKIGDLKLLYEYYREQVIEAGYFEMASERYAFNYDGGSKVNLHTPTSTADLLAQGVYDVNRPLASFSPTGVSKSGISGVETGARELLNVQPVESWEAYQAYLDRSTSLRQAQRAVELELTDGDARSLDVKGTCSMCRNVCQLRASLVHSEADATGRAALDWREQLECTCGFSNKTRAAMHLIRSIVQPEVDSDIYLTERSSQLYKWLKLRHRNLVGSEYLGPNLAPGSIKDGVRHEDVCKLSFSDASFDLALSFDVLDQVEHVESAFFELYRTLKPGGFLVFTAPTQLEVPRILDEGVIADVRKSKNRTEPKYRGNPVDAEKGAPCFRYLGLDTLPMLRSIGFREAKGLFYWSRDYGYLGADQLIYVARK